MYSVINDFYSCMVSLCSTVVRPEGVGRNSHISDGGDRRKFWEEPLKGTFWSDIQQALVAQFAHTPTRKYDMFLDH